MRPSWHLVALVTLTCSDHDRLEVMVTPRYLMDRTTEMGLSSTQRWRGMGWVERVIGRAFDLDGFKVRPWSLAH